jgi:hypothetical protein
MSEWLIKGRGLTVPEDIIHLQRRIYEEGRTEYKRCGANREKGRHYTVTKWFAS